MLQPKRTKFRKQMKGRNRGLAQRGSTVSFGEYALKATDRGRMTARQIEAARRALTRHMKRQGRVWIRIFPDTPITAKPIEVRMGKGKGSVDRWAAKVKFEDLSDDAVHQTKRFLLDSLGCALGGLAQHDMAAVIVSLSRGLDQASPAQVRSARAVSSPAPASKAPSPPSDHSCTRLKSAARAVPTLATSMPISSSRE